MSTVSDADVIDGQTCGAVSNPHPDTNSTCLLSSRPNSVLTWRELKHHIKSCPPSALRRAALYPTVLCPDRPETPSKQCRHCGKRFMLSISLEIHIMAQHASRDRLCQDKGCRATRNKVLFNVWELNLHCSLSRHEQTSTCPFPSCSFGGRREPSKWLKHFASKHFLSGVSLQSLLLCDLEEARTSAEMVDRQKVYLEVNSYAGHSVRRLSLYQRLQSVPRIETTIQKLPSSLTGDDPTSCSQHCRISRRGLQRTESSRVLQKANIPNHYLEAPAS